MTVFARFVDEFPDREENRILVLVDKPSGRERQRIYLDERYCADPECDCQRVMLFALTEETDVLAAIGYDFLGLPERTPEGINPFLEPSMVQPAGAERVLAYVKTEIERDAAFRDRLRRHYRELKLRTQDSAHPLWPMILKDRRMMKRMAENVVRKLF
jgi:hypothetical protein